MNKAAKIPDFKKKQVQAYSKLMNEYPIIGVLNLSNFPAGQLAAMRKKLRDKVLIMGGKKRLYNLALNEAEKTKKDVIKLKEKFEKIQPGLLFTKENPFVLFKILQKSKSNTFAKAGDVAPEDIIIKAGPTQFLPGPIIGELGKFGLKTAVEDGKIAIKQDKVIVKEGEEINGELSGLLMRLDVKPMQIGLDLVAAYEDGFIFDKKIMSVDEQEYIDNVTQGSRWAINLSIEVGIVNKDNAPMFITKAFMDSKGLAISQDILTDATAGIMLAKAESQASALKLQLGV